MDAINQWKALGIGTTTAIGATAGAYVGSNFYEDPAKGAVVGGAIGAAVPFLAKPSLSLAGKGIGFAASKTFRGLGYAASGLFKAGSVGIKYGMPVARDIGKTAFNLGKKIVGGTFKADENNKLKFTGKGKALLGLGSIGIGLFNAADKFINSKAENIAGVASPTPNWEQKLKDRQQEQPPANPGYMFNGGATGDLVFALNALRSGR